MPPSMKQEKKRVSPYTKTNPTKTNVFFKTNPIKTNPTKTNVFFNKLKPAGNKVKITPTIISFGTDRNSIIIDLEEKSIKNKKKQQQQHNHWI